MKRANAGEGAAFSALYRRHRDYVVRVARRFAGDEDLALDAAQETFIYLLGKFPPPRGRRLVLTAKLTSLLYPVAKHAALAAGERKRRMRLGAVGTDLTDPPVTPAAEGFAAEHDLAAVLGRLSEDHREVVMLRFVDGLTVPEIAERVGARVGTVKSRLHHAVAALRADAGVRHFFEVD